MTDATNDGNRLYPNQAVIMFDLDETIIVYSASINTALNAKLRCGMISLLRELKSSPYPIVLGTLSKRNGSGGIQVALFGINDYFDELFFDIELPNVNRKDYRPIMKGYPNRVIVIVSDDSKRDVPQEYVPRGGYRFVHAKPEDNGATLRKKLIDAGVILPPR